MQVVGKRAGGVGALGEQVVRSDALQGPGVGETHSHALAAIGWLPLSWAIPAQ